MKLDLSVCTIVKDEEANIPGLARCIPLDRVEWVVLDTGSRDATADLLRKAGVEPRDFAWRDDFAAARNASLKLARRGWILWLDADDRLEPSFWDALAPLLPGPRRAYRFIVRSPRENSRGECFRQIRLFPAGAGLAFEGRIHEQLGTSLRRLGLEAVDAEPAGLEILHMGYDSPEKREAKRKRNLALLGKERLDHPRDPVVAMEYGNCLFQGGDYAGALAAYRVFLPEADPALCGRAPDDEVLRHFPALVAETCLRLGDEARADGWFALACRWNPADLNPFYRLGKRALARGEISAALDLFHQAIDRPVSVGKVATDNATVRRNALAAAVLCELGLFGAARAPRAREFLRELMAEGPGGLPMDPRVPFEFFRDVRPGGDMDAMEAYARAGFPGEGGSGGDPTLWEDCLEQLLAAGRPAAVLACLEARPHLAMRSGTLEAFRARSLEETAADPEKTYDAYRRALAAFPEDPTLLVYFSEFVNHNRLYARCYADLKAMPGPSAAVGEFLRQLEALGHGTT